jgi:RNA polymerase sigma-70 factor (ECF subfamily)
MVRVDLCDEAIRLARTLVGLMPDEPEVHGLLALLLLQDARRDARTDASDGFIPLEDQDRSLWNSAEIDEGTAILDRVLRQGRAGPYQVQAAIAACHARARDASQTDWHEIALLYRELVRMTNGSPVVELNRAVAVAMADGPAAGLEIVAALEASGALPGYHLLPATKADLLRRLGRRSEAAVAYREAIALATTDTERRYLQQRLAEATAQL